MSSVLCAPSEMSASEPEAKPAASLTTARIVLAPIEAAAARCLSVESASAGRRGLGAKARGPMTLGLPLEIGGVMLRSPRRGKPRRRSNPEEEAHGIPAYDDPSDRSQGDDRIFRTDGI